MDLDKKNSIKAERLTSHLPDTIKHGQMIGFNEEKTAIRVANTMMKTAQEYTLAIEEILKSQFYFSEKQLTEFEYTLKNMLSMQAHVKRAGFSVLNQADMAKVGELAGINLQEERVREFKEGKTGNVPFLGK